MKKLMKTKTIGLALALSVAAARMCFANNPTLGTWKLNESKSTFATAPVKPRWWCGRKLATAKMHGQGTDADGNKLTACGPGNWTGKFYAITGESAGRSTLVQDERRKHHRHGDSEAWQKLSVDGTIVVATDRKSRTVTKHDDQRQGLKVTSTLASTSRSL